MSSMSPSDMSGIAEFSQLAPLQGRQAREHNSPFVLQLHFIDEQ